MTVAAPALDVTLRNRPAQHYLGLKKRVAVEAVGPTVQAGFQALFRRLAETKNRPAGPPFLIAEPPAGGTMEVELGVPCAIRPDLGADFSRGIVPGGKVAVVEFHGAYSEIGPIYRLLEDWIHDHGLRPLGPPREVYLTAGGEEPVTELTWPVT